MSALWQRGAKLQLGKDKWVDGDLAVLNDRISFSGVQKAQIMMANITGAVQPLPNTENSARSIPSVCLSTRPVSGPAHLTFRTTLEFRLYLSRVSTKLPAVCHAALQKAKGAPVIRVGTSSGAKIFQLDSLDAREAFLAVANPVWKVLQILATSIRARMSHLLTFRERFLKPILMSRHSMSGTRSFRLFDPFLWSIE
jgi:hypothetical protein